MSRCTDGAYYIVFPLQRLTLVAVAVYGGDGIVSRAGDACRGFGIVRLAEVGSLQIGSIVGVYGVGGAAVYVVRYVAADALPSEGGGSFVYGDLQTLWRGR